MHEKPVYCMKVPVMQIQNKLNGSICHFPLPVSNMVLNEPLQFSQVQLKTSIQKLPIITSVEVE